MTPHRLGLSLSFTLAIACSACGAGDGGGFRLGATDAGRASENGGRTGSGGSGSSQGRTGSAAGTGGGGSWGTKETGGGAGESRAAIGGAGVGTSSGSGGSGGISTAGDHRAGSSNAGNKSSEGRDGGGRGGAEGQGGFTAVGGSGNAGGFAGYAGAVGKGGAAGNPAATGTGGTAGRGGAPSTGGATGTGGAAGGAAGVCDVSDPPSNVAAWINESWNAEGKNNIKGRSAWLADAAVKGEGQINVCVRWGASSAMTATVRDQLGPQMQRWFNQWFSRIYPYDCFPYPSVTVKVTGYAVRPGKESLLPTGTGPVYTEQEAGSDPAGEPKCPDSCGFFFNWDHDFADCPGGADNHFDYSLWLDDRLPGSGAAAVGGDWGLRMPLSGFLAALGSDTASVILHEIGHGFALSDYYTWKGSTPAGGSVMIVGTSQAITTADQWIARRYWKETKALRFP